MSGFEFSASIASRVITPIAKALYEIWKLALTRGPFGDALDGIMAGIANDLQIPCAMCREYVSWVMESTIIKIPEKTAKKTVEENGF